VLISSLETEGLLIRIPRDSDAESRACDRLLQAIESDATPWAQTRVLVREQPYQIIGAAASSPCDDECGIPSVKVALHVAPPSGAPALSAQGLQRLAQVAQRELASDAIDTQLEESETTFEAPLSSILERLGPLVDWLTARQSVPQQAHFRSWRQTPIDAAARLHAEHIGGPIEGMRIRLERLAHAPDADQPRVLFVGEELAGFSVHAGHGGTLDVLAKVIAPAFRARSTGLAWADLLLMQHTARWAQERGFQRCRFSCMADNVDTRKLAHRIEARVIEHAAIHRLMLRAA
jgi:hypothetical protein